MHGPPAVPTLQGRDARQHQRNVKKARQPSTLTVTNCFKIPSVCSSPFLRAMNALQLLLEKKTLDISRQPCPWTLHGSDQDAALRITYLWNFGCFQSPTGPLPAGWDGGFQVVEVWSGSSLIVNTWKSHGNFSGGLIGNLHAICRVLRVWTCLSNRQTHSRSSLTFLQHQLHCPSLNPSDTAEHCAATNTFRESRPDNLESFIVPPHPMRGHSGTRDSHRSLLRSPVKYPRRSGVAGRVR